MVATVTLIATPDAASTPPRVLLAVTASGTPTVSTVTLSRTDADGNTRLVRTPDGGPLLLSAGAASIYDYEIPYGTAVTYSIAEGSAPSTSAALAVDVPWLVHLGTPTRSVPLDFLRGSSDEESWPIDQGVFPILLRDDPMVITSDTRQSASSTLIVGTDTLEQKNNLRAVLQDGSTLLLNVSPALGLGIETAYVAIGNVTPKRRSDIGTAPFWNFTMPYQTVARPAGGTRAPVTWDDVDAQFGPWSDIPAGTTWAALAI